MRNCKSDGEQPASSDLSSHKIVVRSPLNQATETNAKRFTSSEKILRLESIYMQGEKHQTKYTMQTPVNNGKLKISHEGQSYTQESLVMFTASECTI